jgi:prepilin-type N-terminal cleavage/methylation domain-containing protein
MPFRRTGFTLLELVVVICIVAFLGAYLASRVEVLQARAERASMEHVLGSLRSALALEVARHVARGREAELLKLLGGNPMDRLAERPRNYLGALERAEPASVAKGHWYFDRSSSLLVYRVRHTAFFDSPLPGAPRIRVKISPEFADSNHNGRFDSGADALQGLTVRSLEPYRWLDTSAARGQERS